MYEELTGKQVTTTGLWVHESGVLGASPDGLVGFDEAVDVKSPYTWRNVPDLSVVLPERVSLSFFLRTASGI